MSEEANQHLPPPALQPSNSQQDAESGSSITVGAVIQQVISSITPELLWASNAVATEIARQTQAEMKAWQELQDARRKRDATTFQFEGNWDQFSHENDLLAELENTEVHLTNMEWDKAKDAVQRGKKLINERFTLIKMADTTNWRRVKKK